jgi:hypothetical protein
MFLSRSMMRSLDMMTSVRMVAEDRIGIGEGEGQQQRGRQKGKHLARFPMVFFETSDDVDHPPSCSSSLRTHKF